MEEIRKLATLLRWQIPMDGETQTKWGVCQDYIDRIVDIAIEDRNLAYLQGVTDGLEQYRKAREMA